MSIYISEMEVNTNKNGRLVTTLTMLYHETYTNQSEQQSFLYTLYIETCQDDEDAITYINSSRIELRGDMLKQFIDKFDIDLKLMNDEYILDDNIYLVEFDT